MREDDFVQAIQSIRMAQARQRVFVSDVRLAVGMAQKDPALAQKAIEHIASALKVFEV